MGSNNSETVHKGTLDLSLKNGLQKEISSIAEELKELLSGFSEMSNEISNVNKEASKIGKSVENGMKAASNAAKQAKKDIKQVTHVQSDSDKQRSKMNRKHKATINNAIQTSRRGNKILPYTSPDEFNATGNYKKKFDSLIGELNSSGASKDVISQYRQLGSMLEVINKEAKELEGLLPNIASKEDAKNYIKRVEVLTRTQKEMQKVYESIPEDFRPTKSSGQFQYSGLFKVIDEIGSNKNKIEQRFEKYKMDVNEAIMKVTDANVANTTIEMQESIKKLETQKVRERVKKKFPETLDAARKEAERLYNHASFKKNENEAPQENFIKNMSAYKVYGGNFDELDKKMVESYQSLLKNQDLPNGLYSLRGDYEEYARQAEEYAKQKMKLVEATKEEAKAEEQASATRKKRGSNLTAEQKAEKSKLTSEKRKLNNDISYLQKRRDEIESDIEYYNEDQDSYSSRNGKKRVVYDSKKVQSVDDWIKNTNTTFGMGDAKVNRNKFNEVYDGLYDLIVKQFMSKNGLNADKAYKNIDDLFEQVPELKTLKLFRETEKQKGITVQEMTEAFSGAKNFLGGQTNVIRQLAKDGDVDFYDVGARRDNFIKNRQNQLEDVEKTLEQRQKELQEVESKIEEISPSKKKSSSSASKPKKERTKKAKENLETKKEETEILEQQKQEVKKQEEIIKEVSQEEQKIEKESKKQEQQTGNPFNIRTKKGDIKQVNGDIDELFGIATSHNKNTGLYDTYHLQTGMKLASGSSMTEIYQKLNKLDLNEVVGQIQKELEELYGIKSIQDISPMSSKEFELLKTKDSSSAIQEAEQEVEVKQQELVEAKEEQKEVIEDAIQETKEETSIIKSDVETPVSIELDSNKNEEVLKVENQVEEKKEELIDVKKEEEKAIDEAISNAKDETFTIQDININPRKGKKRSFNVRDNLGSTSNDLRQINGRVFEDYGVGIAKEGDYWTSYDLDSGLMISHSGKSQKEMIEQLNTELSVGGLEYWRNNRKKLDKYKELDYSKPVNDLQLGLSIESQTEKQNKNTEAVKNNTKAVKENVEVKKENTATSQSAINNAEQINSSTEAVKENTEAVKENIEVEQQAKNVKPPEIMYHYGDLDTGKKSHVFADEIKSYFLGKRNGGVGWADGTGTYTTTDINQFAKGSFNDPLKGLYKLDVSGLKLFKTTSEEVAQKFYDFQHGLEQYCISLGSGFDGFEETKNLNPETLYNMAKDVFSEYPDIFTTVFKDVNEFSSFINEMINLVKISGIKPDGGMNPKKRFGFIKENGNDDIKTRFMKKLGFDGFNLKGTSFDSIKSGNVIYDISKATIIDKYNGEEAQNYINRNIQQTEVVEEQKSENIELQKQQEEQKKQDLLKQQENERKKQEELRIQQENEERQRKLEEEKKRQLEEEENLRKQKEEELKKQQEEQKKQEEIQRLQKEAREKELLAQQERAKTQRESKEFVENEKNRIFGDLKHREQLDYQTRYEKQVGLFNATKDLKLDSDGQLSFYSENSSFNVGADGQLYFISDTQSPVKNTVMPGQMSLFDDNVKNQIHMKDVTETGEDGNLYFNGDIRNLKTGENGQFYFVEDIKSPTSTIQSPPNVPDEPIYGQISIDDYLSDLNVIKETATLVEGELKATTTTVKDGLFSERTGSHTTIFGEDEDGNPTEKHIDNINVDYKSLEKQVLELDTAILKLQSDFKQTPTSSIETAISEKTARRDAILQELKKYGNDPTYDYQYDPTFNGRRTWNSRNQELSLDIKEEKQDLDVYDELISKLEKLNEMYNKVEQARIASEKSGSEKDKGRYSDLKSQYEQEEKETKEHLDRVEQLYQKRDSITEEKMNKANGLYSNRKNLNETTKGMEADLVTYRSEQEAKKTEAIARNDNVIASYLNRVNKIRENAINNNLSSDSIKKEYDELTNYLNGFKGSENLDAKLKGEIESKIGSFENDLKSRVDIVKETIKELNKALNELEKASTNFNNKTAQYNNKKSGVNKQRMDTSENTYLDAIEYVQDLLNKIKEDESISEETKKIFENLFDDKILGSVQSRENLKNSELGDERKRALDELKEKFKEVEQAQKDFYESSKYSPGKGQDYVREQILKLQELSQEYTNMRKNFSDTYGENYIDFDEKSILNNSGKDQITKIFDYYNTQIATMQQKIAGNSNIFYDSLNSSFEDLYLMKDNIWSSFLNGDIDTTGLVSNLNNYGQIISEFRDNFYEILKLEEKVGRLEVFENPQKESVAFTKSLKEVREELARISDNKLKGLYSTPQDFNKDLQSVSSRITELSAKKKELEKSSSLGEIFFGTNSTIGQIGRSFTMMMSGYMIISRVTNAFKQGLQVFKDYDSALTTISYTMNMTGTQLSNLGTDAVNMAKDLSTSISNAMDIYQIYANMKTSSEEIEALGTPTGIIANLTGESASTAADQIQGVIQQFDMEMSKDTAMHIADVFDYVSSNIAVDYQKGIQGISEAVQNVGNVAEQAGLSFEQLSSIIGTTMEQTRQEGSQIGNGLKTVMTRLSKASKMDETVSNEDLSNASKVLHEIGVEVYKTSGEFREFDVIMSELAEKWDTLTEAQQANISYQVAATRQTALMKAILSNWDKSMALSEGATNTSGNAQNNQEKYQESLAGRLQAISTEWDSFWIKFYDSDAVDGVLSFIHSVVSGINNVGDSIGTANTALIGAIATIKGLTFITGLFKTNSITKKTGLQTLIDDISHLPSAFNMAASAGSPKNAIVAFGSALGVAEKSMVTFVSTVLPIAGVLVAIAESFVFASKMANKTKEDYKNAIDSTKESYSNYTNSNNEYESLKNKKSNNLDRLREIANNNDIKLNPTINDLDHINDIVNELQDSNISLIDQAEIENIKKENEELEYQLQLQNQLNNTNKQETIENAKNLLNQDLRTSDLDVSNPYLSSYATAMALYSNGAVNAGNYAMENNKTAKITEAVELRIDELNIKDEELQNLKKDYQNVLSSGDEERIKGAQEKIENVQKEYDKLFYQIEQPIENLKIARDALLLSDKEEDKSLAAQLDTILLDFELLGKSKPEKELAKINKYFDGSAEKNLIKNKLQEAVNGMKDGESEARILQEALAKMGLSINDLDGVNMSGLVNYFNKVKESATESQKAIEKNKTTVEDIEAATGNDDTDPNHDWETVGTAIQSAITMGEKDLIGLDNYQSVVSFITGKKYNATGGKHDKQWVAEQYEKDWNNGGKEKAQRYFDNSDEDKAYQSWVNLVTDMQSKDLIDANGKFSKSFKTSGDMARELGISIQAAEVAMDSLEAHGSDMSDIIRVGESYEDASNSIELLKEKANSLQDSAYKNNLLSKIESWETELNNAGDQLENFDTEITTKIKVELEEADIEEQLNQIEESKKTGNETVELNALEIETGSNLTQERLNRIKESNKKDYKNLINSDRYQSLNQAVIDEQNYLKDNAIYMSDTQRMEQQHVIEDNQKQLNEYLSLYQQLKEYSDGGSVDLTNRPIVSGEEMRKSWKEFDGDYATTYTAGYGNKETGFFNFTPILPDGTVMEPGEFDKYCNDVISGVREDDKKLQVGTKFDTEEEADKAAQLYHELQQEFYEQDGLDVDVNAEIKNKSEIEQQIKDLGDGQKLEIRASVRENGNINQTTVTAQNVNGQISYSANLNGVDKALDVYRNEEGEIDYFIDPETQTRIDLIKDQEGQIQYEVTTTGDANVENGTATTTVELDDSKARGGVSNLLSTINSSSGTMTVRANTSLALSSVDAAVTSINRKSATLDVYEHYHKSSSRPGSSGGDSPAHGTTGGATFLHGSAFAKGTNNLPFDWKTKKSETALVGELGPEMLVTSDNRWRTIGDNGPEFTNIPRGSIIFNHKQTEDLLSRGYTKTRGKLVGGNSAFAHGSAYAIHMPHNSNTSVATTGSSGATSGSNNVSKNNMDKFEKWLERLFDWIEVRLADIQRQLDRWVSTAEKLLNRKDYSGATAYYLDAIRSSKVSTNANYNANKTYLQQAYKVGLEGAKASKSINTAWVNDAFNKLQVGGVNIATYGEDKRKVLEAMQEWINKARDCGDAAYDASIQTGEYYEALYNIPLDKASEKIDKLTASISAIGDAIDSIISVGTKTYKSLSTTSKGLITQNATASQKTLIDTYTKNNNVVDLSNLLLDVSLAGVNQKVVANKDALNTATKNLTTANTQKTNTLKTVNTYKNKLKNKNGIYYYGNVGLTKEQKNLIDNREPLDISTLTSAQIRSNAFMAWYASYNASASDYQAALDAYNYANNIKQDAIQNLFDSEVELEAEKINTFNEKMNNVNTYYEAQRSAYSSANSSLEAWMSKKNAAGIANNKTNYNELISNNQKELVLMEKQRDKLLEIINNSGLDKTSTEYLNAMQSYKSLTSEIDSLIQKQYEYNDAIVQLDISKFETLSQIIDELVGKLNNLVSLMELHGNYKTDNQYEQMLIDSMDKRMSSINTLNTYWDDMSNKLNNQWKDNLYGRSGSSPLLGDDTDEKISNLENMISNRDIYGIKKFIKDNSQYTEMIGLEELLNNILDTESELLNIAIQQEEYLDNIITNGKNELDEYSTYLSDIRETTEKALELQKAQYELEKATNNKNIRTWNGSQWVYASDIEAIKDAQENLDKVKYDQLIDSIDKASENLDKLAKELNIYNDDGSLKSSWQDIISNATTSSINLVDEILSKVEEYIGGAYPNATGGVVKGVGKTDRGFVRVSDEERILTPSQNVNFEKLVMLSEQLKGINGVYDLFPENNNELMHSLVSGAMSAINSSNKTITQTFNITMPNITDQTNAMQLMRELESLSLKKVQFFN